MSLCFQMRVILKFILRTTRIYYNLRKMLEYHVVSNTELRGGGGGQSSLTEYNGETNE